MPINFVVRETLETCQAFTYSFLIKNGLYVIAET